MTAYLDEVVPWGRRRWEYERMFALGSEALALRIAGCGDGPASFNAEWTRAGGRVVSVDPAYDLPLASIAGRFESAAASISAHMLRTPERWRWEHHRGMEDLLAARRSALALFLEDLPAGRREGRYVAGALPALPWGPDSFDLALCSHFLFLYSHLLDADFHTAAVREMLRIAPEARLFPLATLEGGPSPHVGPVTDALRAEGASVELVRVPYELQRGANRMMVVRRPAS